jgi:hypothetical protein
MSGIFEAAKEVNPVEVAPLADDDLNLSQRFLHRLVGNTHGCLPKM